MNSTPPQQSTESRHAATTHFRAHTSAAMHDKKGPQAALPAVVDRGVDAVLAAGYRNSSDLLLPRPIASFVIAPEDRSDAIVWYLPSRIRILSAKRQSEFPTSDNLKWTRRGIRRSSINCRRPAQAITFGTFAPDLVVITEQQYRKLMANHRKNGGVVSHAAIDS